MKRTHRILAVLAISATALVGCSGGKLVPSGEGVNSEVPSTIGKYTLVTDENEAELRCQARVERDGAPGPGDEQLFGVYSYTGVFTYVHDDYKKAANNGPLRNCNASGWTSDDPQGVAVVFVYKPLEVREESCTPNDYSIYCSWNIDDLMVGVRASTTGENPPVKKDLKKIAESFAKASKLNG